MMGIYVNIDVDIEQNALTVFEEWRLHSWLKMEDSDLL